MLEKCRPEMKKMMHFSLPLVFIYLCKYWIYFIIIFQMSSSHWFFSIVLSSHWSTCHILGGSIKKYLKFPWLALEASCGFENRANATTVAHNTLGRCMFPRPAMQKQRAATAVASNSTRALHATRQNVFQADSANARGTSLHSPVGLPTYYPCSAVGFNARGPWSTRPLEPSAYYFRIWVITTLPSLKRNFVLEIYLFVQWRITVDIAVS